MKRLAVLATLLVASAVFLVAGATADTVGPITFEPTQGYLPGSIDGQQGWTSPGTNNGPYDANVVSTLGYPAASGYGFGLQALQISDAVATGDFAIQTHSPPLAAPSSESSNPHFEASFSIGTALGAIQPGSHLEVSPDEGNGARMSFLKFADNADGSVHVSFSDVQQPGPCTPAGCANFVTTDIATFQPGTVHSFKYDIALNPGAGNDVVQIFEDGNLIHTGTTWEDYYRYDPESGETGPPAISKLLFRESGTANPADEGNGYLIDNVSLSSGPLTSPPPVFSGITFVNTVESGKGKAPNCTKKNPFKTGTDDVNTFPNAICSSDGNAPKPSTFSWEVELADGTPSNATPVTNTGPPITVTVTKVTTHGKNHGQPPSGPTVGTTATIATGDSATTVPFQVGNIGGGDWIQVTATVTSGGNDYTLEMQVH